MAGSQFYIWPDYWAVLLSQVGVSEVSALSCACLSLSNLVEGICSRAGKVFMPHSCASMKNILVCFLRLCSTRRNGQRRGWVKSNIIDGMGNGMGEALFVLKVTHQQASQKVCLHIPKSHFDNDSSSRESV